MPPPPYSFPSRQASIDTLPAEVLTDIFFISCEQEYDLSICDAILPFQHTLSNVSHRWRTAASQCPTLWSNITIDFCDANMIPTNIFGIRMTPERALDSISLSHRLVRRALANTGNALLDVTLLVSGCKTQHSVLDGVVAILRDIVAQCERWRSFTASITEISTDVFAPLHHHLPQLLFVKIDYSFSRNNPAPDFGGISHIFADAPHLVEAHCKSGFLHYIFFEMPWAQLHKSTLNPSSHQQLVHYLHGISHAQDLRQLALSGCQSLMTRLPMEQQTVLPYVEDLTLTSLDVVPYLRLPSLVSLHVRGNINPNMDAVIIFLTRSECQLRTLYLDSYESPSLYPLFPYLGRLEVLHINIHCSSQPVHLPALQECLSFLELAALRELEVSFGRLSRNGGLESPTHVAGAVLCMVWEAISARKDSASKLRRVAVNVSFADRRKRLWKELLLTPEHTVLEDLRRCSFEVEVVFEYCYKEKRTVSHDILKEAVV